MGAVTSRPQCLAASLVTKMSVALYLFSSRDLVFIGRKKANMEPYDREVFKELSTCQMRDIEKISRVRICTVFFLIFMFPALVSLS